MPVQTMPGYKLLFLCFHTNFQYTHELCLIAGRYLSKNELHALLESYEVQMADVDDEQGLFVEGKKASEMVHAYKTIAYDTLRFLGIDCEVDDILPVVKKLRSVPGPESRTH